jgi:hypothetical protein
MKTVRSFFAPWNLPKRRDRALGRPILIHAYNEGAAVRIGKSNDLASELIFSFIANASPLHPGVVTVFGWKRSLEFEVQTFRNFCSKSARSSCAVTSDNLLGNIDSPKRIQLVAISNKHKDQDATKA